MLDARLVLVGLLCAPLLVHAVTWGDEAGGDLGWGEFLEMDTYTIEAADFFAKEGKGSHILLNVYCHGDLLTSRVMGPGEVFVLDDSLHVRVGRIKVEDLIQNQSRAQVWVRSPAFPDLSLILTSDKDSYRGGEKVRLYLKAENFGQVDAEDLHVSITSEDLGLRENLNKGILSSAETWKEGERLPEIDLTAPYLPQPREMDILATATFRGQDDRMFISQAHASFRIDGPLLLHKRVDEAQRFGEMYYVSNVLRNIGNRTLLVRLEDSAGIGFEGSFQPKDLEIRAGESQSVSYQMRARRPGEGQVILPAKASFIWNGERYQVSSESPIVSVYGPFLEVTRQIRPNSVEAGQLLEVSMGVKNTGNRFAGASFHMDTPDGADMVSGRAEERFRLAPGETKTFNYSLRSTRPGKIVLSPISVRFRDVYGHEFQTDVPSTSATVIDKAAAPNSSHSAGLAAEVESAPAAEPASVGSPLTSILYAFMLVSVGYIVFGRFC